MANKVSTLAKFLAAEAEMNRLYTAANRGTDALREMRLATRLGLGEDFTAEIATDGNLMLKWKDDYAEEHSVSIPIAVARHLARWIDRHIGHTDGSVGDGVLNDPAAEIPANDTKAEGERP